MGEPALDDGPPIEPGAGSCIAAGRAVFRGWVAWRCSRLIVLPRKLSLARIESTPQTTPGLSLVEVSRA